MQVQERKNKGFQKGLGFCWRNKSPKFILKLHFLKNREIFLQINTVAGFKNPVLNVII